MGGLVPAGFLSTPAAGTLYPPGLLSSFTVADVVQYASPATILVGSSGTINPSVLTGTGDVAETGGGDDALADMGATVNASTGVVTYTNAVGPDDYSFELARNGGSPFTWIVHVVRAGGDDGGAVQRSAVQASAIQTSAIEGSAIG